MLSELKQRLRITWTEDDAVLNEMLEGSKAYLEELTGTSFDYATDYRAKELVLERCRYVFHNAGDEFEKNYKSELQRLILTVALEKEGANNETTTSG